MSERHWTEDDFLDRLYGVGPEDGHLVSCAECRKRMQDWEERRQPVLAEQPVDPAFLERQRRAILERAGRREPPPLARWSPVVVVSALVLAALALQTPGPEPRALAESRAEARLWNEIYAYTHSAEPVAAAPLRGLFLEE